ncbi:MAG: hypothetical protein GC162_09560 [Planctomycetes bacterium]|nr:hypothetical protein [Planctomycetota bacterium]
MRVLIPFILIAVLLAAFMAWDRPEPRAELVSAYTSIGTIDPQMVEATEDVRVAYALFEGLCTFDPDKFTVIPGIASSWDISEDGNTFTFHLRPDARWSDGSPLTAQDFRYTWRIGLMPDTAEPYQQFLLDIKGGKAFFDWCDKALEQVNAIADPSARMAAARQRVQDSIARFDELVSVKLIDEHTLSVTTERHIPYMLEIFASWPTFPLPRHVVEPMTHVDGSSRMLRRDPQWVKPDHIVCNGPYILTDWQFKRYLSFAANPYYWNAQNVACKTVRLDNYKDPGTMFVAYESGSLDVMIGAEALKITPELIAAGRAGLRDDVHEVDGYGTYYYVFNAQKKLADGRDNPFYDPRVRKAFALSIDKKALTERVTRLYQTPTNVFVPKGAIEGYRSPAGLDRDPELARKLLAEAGYPGGQGLPVIEMTYNTGSGHDNIAQAIAKMWADELGVKVATDAQEWKVFLTRRGEGKFMIARGGWFGDYTDPTTFLNLFQTGDPKNEGRFTDPKYDAMLAEAARTLDPQKRLNILSEAENYVMTDQMPIVPLYYYKLLHMYDPKRVSGVSLHPRNLQMYHLMKITGGR